MFSKIKQKLFSESNVRFAAIITIATLASRVFGAIRTIFVTKLDSVSAELYNFAFTIPDNIISIFIVGSITVAILPNIVSILKTLDKKTVNNYISWFILIFNSLLLLVSIVCIVFADKMLLVLNPNVYNSLLIRGRVSELVDLTRILLFSPVIFSFKTILGSFLNTVKSFFVYSLDGVITNVGIIFGLTILYKFFGLRGAGMGVLTGHLIVLILFVFNVYKYGFYFYLGEFGEVKAYLTSTLTNYLPRLFIISSVRVSQTLVSILAVSVLDGDISIFNLASDIGGVFIGLLTGVGVVFLPDLTKFHLDTNEGKKFWEHLFKYLKFTALIGLIGGVLTGFLLPILLHFLNYFKLISPDSFIFSYNSQQKLLLFTFVCLVSIVFQSTGDILNRYFAAIKNTKTPFIASVLGNISAIIISFLFTKNLGAGLAVSIGFSVNNFVLTGILGFVTYTNWKKSKSV